MSDKHTGPLDDDEVPKEVLEALKRDAYRMARSGFFLNVFLGKESSAKNALAVLQIGLAVHLDLPIVLLVPEHLVLEIPDNLRRLSRHMEIYKAGDSADLERAMRSLLTFAGKEGFVKRP